MTLPTLINNYQKAVTTTKLKRLYSLLINVNQRAENDFGPSEYWDYPMSSEDGEYNGLKIEEFFNKYYAPYIKTSELVTNLTGKNYKVRNFNGDDAGYDRNANQRGVRYRLNDGMCITMWAHTQSLFITTDVNCEKPPNVLGKDVFDIAELYWVKKKNFYLLSNIENKEQRQEVIERCKSATYTSGADTGCFRVFVYDGWQFKDDYPW